MTYGHRLTVFKKVIINITDSECIQRVVRKINTFSIKEPVNSRKPFSIFTKHNNNNHNNNKNHRTERFKEMIVCKRTLVVLVIVTVMLLTTVCDGRKRNRRYHKKSHKQLLYEERETNPPNFVRLVVMRLIYGIATQIGVEERLEDLFNGAFVPPNADDDYGPLGGGGGGGGFGDFGDSDGGLFDFL